MSHIITNDFNMLDVSFGYKNSIQITIDDLKYVTVRDVDCLNSNFGQVYKCNSDFKKIENDIKAQLIDMGYKNKDFSDFSFINKSGYARFKTSDYVKVKTYGNATSSNANVDIIGKLKISEYKNKVYLKIVISSIKYNHEIESFSSKKTDDSEDFESMF